MIDGMVMIPERSRPLSIRVVVILVVTDGDCVFCPPIPRRMRCGQVLAKPYEFGNKSVLTDGTMKMSHSWFIIPLVDETNYRLGSESHMKCRTRRDAIV